MRVRVCEYTMFVSLLTSACIRVRCLRHRDVVGRGISRRSARAWIESAGVSSGVVSSTPASNSRAVDGGRAHVFACCKLVTGQLAACVTKGRERADRFWAVSGTCRCRIDVVVTAAAAPTMHVEDRWCRVIFEVRRCIMVGSVGCVCLCESRESVCCDGVMSSHASRDIVLSNVCQRRMAYASNRLVNNA